MSSKTCGLCGTTDHNVSEGLVEWIDPIESQRFSSLPRCQDIEACRQRVEKAGERWDVVESGPQKVRR